MKNAIILHGKPSKQEYEDPSRPSSSNYHWIPWLQKQLLVNDVAAHTPEVPLAWHPDWELWKGEFERYDITTETILVGHSCGGGFLVRWLSENKDKKVGTVVVVAPWVDPDRESTSDFFEFTIDPELAKRTKRLIIFNSDDDHASIHKTVDIIKKQVTGVDIKDFHNYGHFTVKDMKTSEFPELLKACLS